MVQTRKKRKKNNDNNCSSSIESSHQQKKKKKKELISSSSSWNSLPNDVLLNIFNRLDDRIYLFWIVSSVCRSWQLSCWEILFWKGNQDDEQFDLGGLSRFCYDEVEDNFDKLDLALGKVMRSVFDRHGDIFDDIRYKFHDMMLPLVHNKDKYLVYVAERTPKLQKVSLDMHGITGKGFSRSIRNWRQLEVIFMVSLSGCHCTHIIQEIGINCGKLKMFNILSCTDPSRTRFSLNEYNCQVIADNLCNLRASGISNCYINKLGLLIIMSKCKQLKRLCLIRCIRSLEDVKLTRGRGALDAKPLKVIPEPLSVFIHKCQGSDSEWWINTLPGKHNIRSVISHLWMEPRDVLTSISSHL